MDGYFSQFPVVIYNDNTLRNILLHVDFVKETFNRYDVYYPYTIEDWERPDTIAADYYGDSKYYWVVMMANDIHNVYEEWFKPEPVFRQWVERKYSKGIYELMNEIKHYVYEGPDTRITHTLTPLTFSKLTVEEQSFWKPVMVYDYERDINESKRHLRLLDNEYLPQLKDELKRIFG